MMKQTNRIVEILDILNNEYPDARCMLDYNKDYELVIAVMLSAQTTDVAVNKVTSVLFDKYKDLESLASSNFEDVFEIVKKLGLAKKKAQNVIEIAKILQKEHDGKVVNDRDALAKLPGVGRKTINVVLSELFDCDTLAVDTHVSRLSIRLGFAKKGDDPLTIENKLLKIVPKGSRKKAHHLLIRHGRSVCKANGFSCSTCSINGLCKKVI